ncbi:MAG TPA: hypothetical protein VGR28_15030 [Candidatus Thermoplasmatota archaeon]|jgi:hypothetical protein|nr:hypothetical protein [Candidatus Thermoplasmatota archaeon]
MATTTSGLVEHYLSEAKRIEEIRRARKKFRNVEAFPFWPHEAVRSTIIVLAFSAMCIYISALMPYFLEAPANPAGQPEVILPDWYLLWSYGLLKPGLADGIAFGGSFIDLPLLGPVNAKTMGILLNILITVPLIVMPFISTGHPRRPQEAPWTAAFGVAGIVYVFNASVYSVNNVIYSRVTWWGDGMRFEPTGYFHPIVAAIHSLTGALGGLMQPLTCTKGAGGVYACASALPVLAGVALWVVPLPLAAYAVRRYWLKEDAKFAATIAAVEALILVTLVGYAANLDVVKLVQNPISFFYTALDGKASGMTLLAWYSWWTTLLAFEIAYWSLVAWKQHSVRQDTYEHGLNLTYFKVR